jgi:hypothetical protein
MARTPTQVPVLDAVIMYRAVHSITFTVFPVCGPSIRRT